MTLDTFCDNQKAENESRDIVKKKKKAGNI